MADEKTPEETAEEAAEVAAVEAGKETPETPAEPKAETPAPAPAAPGIDQVVAKLAEALQNKELSPEQREAQLKQLEESSGFSRKQLQFMQQSINQQATAMNVGLAEELGRGRAEKALGGLKDQLLDKVTEAMKKQPLQVQADPNAWENMAYLIKGKEGDKIAKPAAPAAEGAPADRKVVGGAGGAGMGPTVSGKSGSSKPAASGSKKYSEDEQTMITRYFGGKADEYEKYSKNKQVGVGADAPVTSGNTADKEYARLTGGNYQ